jgi:hypothetical protein
MCINCEFNTLGVNEKHGDESVITALQLVLGIGLLGAVIWIGDALAGGIEAALGEKPLRDRDATRR